MATPFKTFKLPDLARLDLELFQAILAQADLGHVPAASEMIRAVSEKSSGTDGPAFFSINVREHLSLCLAASIWARAWSTLDKGTLHVHAWIDNSSSVSRANKLAASNVYAQELNRHLALAQAVNRLYVTAGHMAGVRNEMADCGSRSLAEPFKSRHSVHVQADVRRFQDAALATSTHERYNAAWEQWRTWREHRRQSPWLSKEEREQTDELVQYVLHLRDGGNSAATFRSKLYGIAWRHQRHGWYTVALAPDHRLVLRGMERDDGATR
ncbi:hypothetical protein SDRG_15291 [Saprolegnia diclina VS20]|uniref:Uncharacterized protein n=1 Tax=Saprolegnia diclina (strain VS20) TaxID=1156394 RepID=T0R491_SAPDV|nr:hypothetical protein SDRG_15291 [Saprolegnia diclina VS20]EQC26868.1 hypothetical protein SDRG_15291 [Saprolegnia diclina VS20]|eukprot:XP_008619681.1 hypothetical protein SDRG_15291 [Saprolegnia diclina VS20]